MHENPTATDRAQAKSNSPEILQFARYAFKVGAGIKKTICFLSENGISPGADPEGNQGVRN